MKQGTVKWFDEKKGFGFLTDGHQDYFVHYKQISNGRSLMEWQKVEFEAVKGPKGWGSENISVI